MNIPAVIMRSLHILGGVIWVGTIFVMAFFIQPAMRAAGSASEKFGAALGKHTKIGVILPIASGLNLLTGLMMYLGQAVPLGGRWITTPAGMVLTIGGLSALVAFFGPGLAMGRVQKRLGALGQEIAAAGEPPTEGKLAELKRLQSQVGSLYGVMAVLLIITVLCMSIFRYV